MVVTTSTKELPKPGIEPDISSFPDQCINHYAIGISVGSVITPYIVYILVWVNQYLASINFYLIMLGQAWSSFVNQAWEG